MRRPSVLFINRVYPPYRGASGRVLRDLAKSFSREGWTVTVLTTGPQAKAERDGHIRVKRVRAPVRARTFFSTLMVWIRLLWAGLRLPRHDLVVTLTDPPMLVVAGRWLSRMKRSRHMHWCHDLYPDILPALGIELPEWLSRRLTNAARKAMKRCDRVIVVGRCMARILTQRGFDPKRISYIPNWPDFELVAQVKKAQTRPIDTFNGVPVDKRKSEPLFRDVQNPKFRILYAGNLGRAHPLETILDAAQILMGTHGDVELVFVGDGPQFDKLSQERARRGLDNIRLLPWQPASRLRALMESGDVHLVTMKHDAVGMMVPCKFYAALAVGRPVIMVGPGHGEVGQVIEEFNAGMIVPQGDAQALAAAIVRYREDGEAWFAAHDGAMMAARVYQPYEAVKAWIERARAVVALDLPAAVLSRPRRRLRAGNNNNQSRTAAEASSPPRKKQTAGRAA